MSSPKIKKFQIGQNIKTNWKQRPRLPATSCVDLHVFWRFWFAEIWLYCCWLSTITVWGSRRVACIVVVGYIVQHYCL